MVLKSETTNNTSKGIKILIMKSNLKELKIWGFEGLFFPFQIHRQLSDGASYEFDSSGYN